MKINRDMLFAAGTVVAIAIAVVAAVLLFGGISKFSTAEKKLQNSIKRLRALYAQKPFPSEKNVERERQNAKRLVEWYAKLNKSLHEGEIAPNPADKSPSRWTAMYGVKRSDLRKKAADGGIDLPPDFAFGFDEYAGGVPPAPPDVSLLTQQLKIVDMLCTLLMKQDVASIAAVKRQAVQGGTATSLRTVTRPRSMSNSLVGAASSRRSSSRRQGSSSRRSSSRRQGSSRRKAPAAKAAASEVLYAKQHFEIEFEARERTVLNVLNKLAASKVFIVISSVSMARKEDDILTAEQTIRPGGVDAVPLADMQGDDYPSSIERMVCGIDLEKPMKVTVKLNVYNFLGE
ncbi:hypothetical protein ACFLQU_01915 [Verrucomicrobiota bacterium]